MEYECLFVESICLDSLMTKYLYSKLEHLFWQTKFGFSHLQIFITVNYYYYLRFIHLIEIIVKKLKNVAFVNI